MDIIAIETDLLGNEWSVTERLLEVAPCPVKTYLVSKNGHVVNEFGNRHLAINWMATNSTQRVHLILKAQADTMWTLYDESDLDYPGIHMPRGLFVWRDKAANTGDSVWTAMDNMDGTAYVEDFRTLDSAVRWLIEGSEWDEEDT